MSTRLLYYNPNVATHPDTHKLPGMERFSQFFKIYNPTVVFIDRTEAIKIPIRVTSLFPMPALRPIAKSFEDICNERARELLGRAEALNVNINVLWSGGIDSTLVLVSLLKNVREAQRKRIVVLLNEESIEENPIFYRDHIKGRLQTASSTMLPYRVGGNDLVLGGEHNDQLFGSDVMAALILRYGSSVIHARYNHDHFYEFFHEKLPDAAGVTFYLDLLERHAQRAPVPIVSNFDFVWWINFSLKWQSVFMRSLAHVATRNVSQVTREYITTKYAHFYGTDDFQLWSLNNQDKKIKDSWETYKWVCKDIIYDYTKDAEYRDHKTKRGSLHFLLLQQQSYNFIDERMQFSYAMDPQTYYEADNDFV